MHRLALISILILVLLAGCTTPAAQPLNVQPEAAATSTSEVKSPAETATLPEVVPTVEPTTEPAATPTEAASPAFMAYVDRAGNLNLLDLATGESRAITTDGTPQPFAQPGVPTLYYMYPRWSSDNRLLAAIREVGVPVESGFQSEYSLWVYDVQTGQSSEYQQGKDSISGFSWKPGTHTIAFSRQVDPNYWFSRTEKNPEFATGIWSLDAETGEVAELVKPERGFPLIDPRWSPDGQLLSFNEVEYMEGAGKFAYYDFAAGKYVAWDKVIGMYDWSPDGQWIAYDRLSYAPSTDERIWKADRQGQNEVQLTPDVANQYQIIPRWSPDGTKIAYWQMGLNPDGVPETEGYQLFVINADSSGEPTALGSYKQVSDLNWSPDGSVLLFTAGEVEARSVYEVPVSGGAAKELVQGMYTGVTWPQK